MSLAEQTREAVRRRPFLQEALRAGVVNYTAAARFLAPEIDVADQDDGLEAIATALARYAEALPAYETEGRSARVTMESRLGVVESAEEGVLAVGDESYVPGAGSLTGVLATGDVDATVLGVVIGRLETASVDPVAAGYRDGSLAVVVERRDGPDAVRAVEDALEVVASKE